MVSCRNERKVPDGAFTKGDDHMVRGKLVFITGGVRSGKSSFAEQYLMNEQATRNVYIASGSSGGWGNDGTYSKDIKTDRESYPVDWVTTEQPRHFEQVIPTIQSGDGILWDCVTTWLANELYEGEMEKVEKQSISSN